LQGKEVINKSKEVVGKCAGVVSDAPDAAREFASDEADTVVDTATNLNSSPQFNISLVTDFIRGPPTEKESR